MGRDSKAGRVEVLVMAKIKYAIIPIQDYCHKKEEDDWRGWAHPIAEQYSVSDSVGGSEMGAKSIKDYETRSHWMTHHCFKYVLQGCSCPPRFIAYGSWVRSLMIYMVQLLSLCIVAQSPSVTGMSLGCFSFNNNSN